MEDIFEHRYYRMNKLFMKLTGHWPHQRLRVRLIITIALFFVSCTIVIPHGIAVVKNRHDREFLLDCGPGLLFTSFVVTKHFSAMFNAQNILKLLNFICADWEDWAQDRDIDVLHEYAQVGRKLTIIYGVTSCQWGTLAFMQPVVPKIIDVLLRNGTKPGQFPLPVDYMSIDTQKYYFYITLNLYICVSVAYVISITYDCMLFVFIQHGCGLFATLRCKLEQIGDTQRSPKKEKSAYYLSKRDTAFQQLVFCISIHNHAIEFAELIEETYTWCFLFIMGINMILISVCGVEIVMNSHDPQAFVRYVTVSILAVVHLYIDSYMTQRLWDHSTSIRQQIVNGNWYELSPKNQRILLFMMMRCNTPCRITAGKIIVMSVKTFTMVLKTSISYFTLLRTV